MLWSENRGYQKKPVAAEGRTQDMFGLSHQCCAWATTAGQLPTPIILYVYCTGGTECLSRTPCSHSVCAIRTPLGVNQKILSIRKEPMLSGFLSLNAQSILLHAEYRCYELKI